MIIYKNVDYGIYAYQIGFFKVKRIGEIVWSDHYDSKMRSFICELKASMWQKNVEDMDLAVNC